jgi:hypothetical protein
MATTVPKLGEAEIAHLKKLLAARPTETQLHTATQNGRREDVERLSREAERERTLRELYE